MRVTLDDNTICNVEVQLTDKHNIEKRLLNYWSRVYGGQLKRGEDYNKLKPVISILIADYELEKLKEEKAVTRWKIIETEKRKKCIDRRLGVLYNNVTKGIEGSKGQRIKEMANVFGKPQ